MTNEVSVWGKLFYNLLMVGGNAFGVIFFISQILRPKYARRIVIGAWGGVLLFAFLCNPSTRLIPESVYSMLITILMVLLIVIVYSGKLIWKIMVYCMMVLAQLVAAIPVYMITSVLKYTYDQYWQNPVLLFLENCIFSNIVLVLTGVLCSRILGKQKELLAKNETALLLLVLCNYIGIMAVERWMLHVLDTGDAQSFWSFLLLSIALIISVCFLSWLLIKMMEKGKSELEMMLLCQRYELAVEHIKQSSEYSESVNQLYFQMDAVLGEVLRLTEHKQLALACEYIEKNYNEIAAIPRPQKLGHPIAEYLISRLEMQCEEEQVSLDLQVELPKEIGISDIDFCTVLSNLIDNAWREVRNMQKMEKEIGIWLQMHMNGNVLYVSCRNTKAERERKNRRIGFGLKNVREVVEKYNGLMNIENLKTFYKIEVILYRNK